MRKLPDGVVLEGAGDCVFDQSRNMFWLGYGQRSDAAAQHAVEEMFGIEVTPLELADPRFYHMDTALSALPRGEVMYVPEAFTAAGLATIRARVPRGKRIEVGIADAQMLAANAVCLGDTLVMAGCGERLRATLEERGYRVAVTPLRSFLKQRRRGVLPDLAARPALAAGHRDGAGRGGLSAEIAAPARASHRRKPRPCHGRGFVVRRQAKDLVLLVVLAVDRHLLGAEILEHDLAVAGVLLGQAGAGCRRRRGYVGLV